MSRLCLLTYYAHIGFCMRGDQCKFDHGNDAVILADSVGGVPAYNPAAPSAAPSLDTTIPPPSTIHGVPPPTIVDPYVPASSVIIDPNVPPPVTGEPMPPLHLPPPGFPAPLHVPPPVTHIGINPGQKRSYEGGGLDSANSGFGPPAKRGFDYNRLGRGSRGGSRGRGFSGRGGCSAQVSAANNMLVVILPVDDMIVRGPCLSLVLTNRFI